MQDRFKFRFWHKPTEKMVGCYGYNPEFVFGNVLDGIGTTYNPAKFEDCILMQCTGLKDKNGKLIYEGDILEDSVHKFKVVWNGYSFVISGGSKKDEEKQVYFFPLLARTFEVIGNIYENAELLEE